MIEEKWEQIQPTVNAEAEFFEILNDFENPLEILREAISNSIDAHASHIKISISVKEVDGNKRLVIDLEDNGDGMTEEVLRRDFWGLGFSPSRERSDAIGEKGHGTKIYLRSSRVEVRTTSTEGALEAECDNPLGALYKKELHKPRIRRIEKYQEGTGTHIRIIGYNDNERSNFIQLVVADYIKWFTKVGSVELMFGNDKLKNFKVYLKCIGQDTFEEMYFGHVFPDENADIHKLFHDKESYAADHFVQRFIWAEQRLKNAPETTYDVIISVEGDAAKRDYNKMLGERRRKDTGRYRVSDRYGIYLCKDYIPIVRVNDWIKGFGTGSNSYVLLHGFINCQDLKLTANRGGVANTDPKVLEELKESVQKLIAEVDTCLHDKSIYTLVEWQKEERTIKQEEADFKSRTKKFKNRKIARLDERTLIEPLNESELFGLFIIITTLHPELFDFEPLDYNTHQGIDIIARNKTNNRITEGEHWYIELKYLLKSSFNHSFKYLKYIVCWDFDPALVDGAELYGLGEGDNKRLRIGSDRSGWRTYFLDHPSADRKVRIIKLKEFLKERLGLEFKHEEKVTSIN